MNFKEIIVFILLFIVVLNVFNFLRFRWSAKKKIDNGVSAAEKIIGLVTLSFILIMCVYLLYYSFLKYRNLYGTGMAIVASIMIFSCISILFKQAFLALRALFQDPRP